MLTRKQRDLLLFIHERMSGGDIAPSFDEMKEALGLKSKSGVHRLINGLVERGHLERLPHRARALSVRKLPEGYKPQVAGKEHGDNKDIQNVSAFRAPSPVAPVIPISFYGKIAAGTPIEALRDEGASIDLPAALLGNGVHYALTVEGDSMVDAGIRDGDIVVIRRGDSAENGSIVVALIDDQEATLKRLRREQGKIVLEAENPAYPARILDSKRVKVQGKLVSLLRNYH